MPLYEFYCPVCQKSFEFLMSFKDWKDSPAPVCPTQGCCEQMGTHPGLQPCVTLMGKAVVK